MAQGLDQYLTNFSTDGLTKMQKAVFDALRYEDSQGAAATKPYGVRQYPDWRMWSDALEAELEKRKVPFARVQW